MKIAAVPLTQSPAGGSPRPARLARWKGSLPLLPALLLCLPIAACTAPDSGKGKAPADQSAAAPATR